MKITDLVGRLAAKYPGITMHRAPDSEHWVIAVPGIAPLQLAEYEIIQQSYDDQVVELVDSRIQRRMEQVHA